MIRKSFLFLLAALLVLAVFVSCDADQMAKFGKTLSGTGTNIYNPDGITESVQTSKSMVEEYMNAGSEEKSAALKDLVTYLNDVSFSDQEKEKLQTALSAESEHDLSGVVSTYTTSRDDLNSKINNITDEEIRDTVVDNYEDFKGLYEWYIQADGPGENKATYLEILVAGAICDLFDTVYEMIENKDYPETTQELIDFISPVVSSLETIDKLTGLGIFDFVVDIISTLEEGDFEL